MLGPRSTGGEGEPDAQRCEAVKGGGPGVSLPQDDGPADLREGCEGQQRSGADGVGNADHAIAGVSQPAAVAAACKDQIRIVQQAGGEGRGGIGAGPKQAPAVKVAGGFGRGVAGEGRSGQGHHWGQPPVARDPKGEAVGREVVEAVLDAAENLRWQCCVRGEGNEAGVKRDGGGMGAPLRVGQGAGDAVGCQHLAAKAGVGQRRLADKAGQTAWPSGYSAGPLTFSLLPKGSWK